MHVTLTVGIGLLILCTVTEAHLTNNTDGFHSSSSQQNATDIRTKEKETGRDKKLEKYILPVAIGFKLTSLVTAAFTALKIFIFQSLVVSKIALFGATLLALKVIYDHMRHKYSHLKGIGWDDHLHYKPLWDWYPYPYPPHDWDSHASPSELRPLAIASESDRSTALPRDQDNFADRTALPRDQDNFAVRSDKVRGRPQKKPGVGYGTVITRITETTSED